MNTLLTKAHLFLKRNSSTILTCAGAAGVIATTVMAVKATPKALTLLEQAKEEKGEELTKLEIVQVAGPVYIPSIVMGAATITCVFGANMLNQRQQASLISAYTLVDNSYKEYKKKLKELHGDEIDQQIRHAIVEDRFEECDFQVSQEKHLFFDYYSLRYFESTVEEVLMAENRFNKNFALSGYAALNDFYDTVGLPHTDYGYEVGWSLEAGGAFYNYSWIDFNHEKILLEDGLECYIISMEQEPTADYLGF